MPLATLFYKRRVPLDASRKSRRNKAVNRSNGIVQSSNNPRIPLPALIPQQPQLPPFEVGSLKMSDLRLAIVSHGDHWHLVRRLGLLDTLRLSSSSHRTACTSDKELPFFFTFRLSNPLFDHSAAQLSILTWWSDWKQQQQSMDSRPSPAANQTPRGPISFAEGQLPAIDPEPPPTSQRRGLHLQVRYGQVHCSP
ncbi:hypothetical protein DIS24_g9852 [Lasiodiplodia hormozganensis]|uniref:Uncharacterized protein n=1 Tax=Lasiodiplodia hormozganensis TaxID=869390 RepID=A0AA39XQT1_9PEZI|nr:hypothetical protein DIS24_g9852 [Lasiodiplodia hormozganensis]